MENNLKKNNMKQETIEEAAEILYPYDGVNEDYKIDSKMWSFIAGAKWQQERMYTEESECVNMYLDDLSIQRKSEDGQEYSIVGRIKQLEKKYLKEMSDVESHYLSKKERMYSEEDMAESFMACWTANVPYGFECKLSFKEWFEQFKKK
jgi:hypothetical protein